jgi:hypothetical protein
MVEALHLQERELADAMLEGIERRPDQSFGEYYRGRKSSCALGAAYEGIYRIPRNADGIRPKRLDLLFDCLDNEVRRCPACAKKRLPIGAIIIHLNDHHQWTREQIAHWLRDDADARAAASARPGQLQHPPRDSTDAGASAGAAGSCDPRRHGAKSHQS